MRARPIDEPHRASSPLELLFDLTFVVAIASIVGELAHGIGDGHAGDVITPFLQVFFAIWWAWMNFTWFASSFDTDDVLYRLLTLVQMGGVLVLAAGVPSAFGDGDFGAVTLGYVLMRLGLVAQWLRVAREDAECRGTALHYAAGIVAVQVLWVVRFVLAEADVLPERSLVPIFVVLVVLELAVPPYAERWRATSWHPHHMAERYGLFTIIVLGESVLAASGSVTGAFEADGVTGAFLVIAIAGLALLFALWWLYFLEPAGDGLARHRESSYLWGYGHYGIFAALAAVGAGLELAVEQTSHPLEASSTVIGYTVAIPVAAFLVLLGAAHAPIVERLAIRPAATAAAVVAVLLLPLAPVDLALVVAGVALVGALLIADTLLPRAR